MASLRHISQRECIQCHGPMTGTTRRRYCSDICSLKAYRERKALLCYSVTVASPGSNGGDPGNTGVASGPSEP